MSEVIRQLKIKQRSLFKSKILSELSEKKLSNSSFKLASLLSRLNIWRESLIVASYRALPGEISLLLFEKEYFNKLNFVYPKMEKQVESFVFPDKTEKREKSSWPEGYQPASCKEVSLNQIDIFLVPGLAFDRRGYRLGRGGGFYDRVLSQSCGIKIGIASSSQVSCQDIPVENHDIKMDIVVTESYFFVPLKHTHFLKGVY